MANILGTNGPRALRNRREKIDPARIEFKRLSADCARGAFSCGYTHIDHFINNSALEEHEGLRSRTVTAHLDGAKEPVGFYAMTISTEPDDQFIKEEDSFFEKIKARFFGKQLMTVQLIWVGVETAYHRHGIGTLLMGHALDDFYQVVDRTGIAAMTLHPISINAASFYSTIGFVPYGSKNPKRMVLSAEAVMAFRMRNGSPPEENGNAPRA